MKWRRRIFGFLARKRAVSAAIQITRPAIRTLATGGDLPKRFWNDPYALGFLVTTMGFVIEFADETRSITDDERIAILIEALNRVSGLDGSLILNGTEMYMNRRDREFELGGADAKKVLTLTACFESNNWRKGMPIDSVGTALFHEFFTEQMRVRLYRQPYRFIQSLG